MVSLTNEQFQQLLSQVNKPDVRYGSFGNCTARYNGERNPSRVEEFISAVSTYKTVERVTDENAINGMPMLLEGDAAEWWRGVKSTVKKFDDVIRMLREAFAPPKPAWRIYAEINESKQQMTEPTDSFIRKKRALFARLTSCPIESDQIDMLFGLLHSQIRERIFRHKVKTFDELLADAREAEHVLAERIAEDVKAGTSVAAKEVLRCSFCRRKGHTELECFKKKEALAEQPPVKSDPIVLKPKYACYGCGTPGVVRAKCPNCSKERAGGTPLSVAFNSLGLCTGRDIPMVNVEIFGVPGQAYFDCGAKTSIASANLKRVMEFHGCKFDTIRCQTTLADGSTSIRNLLSTTCKIQIGGRCLNVKFLVFPEGDNNRTLLGADFMEEAEIVMRMGQRSWHFENCPDQVFYFAKEWPLDLNLLETISVTKRLPEPPRTKGAAKQVDFKLQTPARHHNENVSDFENTGPDYYSPHSIQSIFRGSIPDDLPTPDRAQDKKLFTGVIYRMDDDYNDSIFVPLNAFEYDILKPSDAIDLSTEEKLQLDNLLKVHTELFSSFTPGGGRGAASENTPTPFNPVRKRGRPKIPMRRMSINIS